MIKESNIFGDVLSSIMRDDKPKPKKRRLSDIKAEREAKVGITRGGGRRGTGVEYIRTGIKKYIDTGIYH